MASNVIITFTINAEGDVEYSIDGIKGTGCEELTKLFENLGDTIEEKNTAEYYQKEVDHMIKTRYGK